MTGAVTSVQNVIRSRQPRRAPRCRTSCSSRSPPRRRCSPPRRRSSGVVLIDIGGGTTDVALFRDGAIWHTAILPLGGDHITNDIAVGLRTPIADAEELKKRYGCALTALVPARTRRSTCRRVGGRKPRQLSRQILSEIIQPRVEEIFTLVARELARGGLPGRGRGRRGGHGRQLDHGGRARARRAGLRPAGAPRGARRTSAGSRTWCGARSTPPAVGLALYGARGHGAGGGPTKWTTARGRSHRPAPDGTGLRNSSRGGGRRGSDRAAAGHGGARSRTCTPVGARQPRARLKEDSMEQDRARRPLFELDEERAGGEDQGDRPRRRRRQRGQPHDGGRASPAWTSSSPTPTCRRSASRPRR